MPHVGVQRSKMRGVVLPEEPYRGRYSRSILPLNDGTYISFGNLAAETRTALHLGDFSNLSSRLVTGRSRAATEHGRKETTWYVSPPNCRLAPIPSQPRKVARCSTIARTRSDTDCPGALTMTPSLPAFPAMSKHKPDIQCHGDTCAIRVT